MRAVTLLVTHTTLSIFTYSPTVNMETQIPIMSGYTRDC